MEDDLCNDVKVLHGLFNPKRAHEFLSYDLPRTHIQIALIFTLSHSIHFILKKVIHLPRICSDILAGMVLGPTVLGQIENFDEILFPVDGEVLLYFFSRLGLIFVIFLVGVKMSTYLVLRAGWSEWSVGLSGVFMTKGLSNYLVGEFVYTSQKTEILGSIIFAQCYITVPVVASVLEYLEIMNSELGRFALSSALVSDLAFTTLIIFFEIEWKNELEQVFYQSLVLPFIFIVVTIIIMKPIAYWIMKQTPDQRPVKTASVMTMCFVMLALVIAADHYGGVHYEISAFIIGCVLPEGPPLGSSLDEKLETLVDGFLNPLVASLCGTKVNLFRLYDLVFIKRLWFVVWSCLLIKILMILFPALLFRIPLRDALVLAFVLSYQGNIQLSNHFSFLVTEDYDEETMTIMVLSVLVIAASTAALAKLTYNYSSGYGKSQKRTIQHRLINSDLSLVSCIYHLDDVFVMKGLLEASIQDKESTLSVYVVNLVELVGRDTPQLIDHKFNQKGRTLRCVRAEKLFEIFTSFRHQHKGLVDIELLTAISMHKFMHQDICSLAFKKLVSVIILPFHRKWNSKGKVVSDNSNLRKVNCNVLKTAPCSVGILIDRHRSRHLSQVVSSASTVAVLFIGGADDREALSYGKHMARSPGVHLTVVRLVGSTTHDQDENQYWDILLDEEALEDLKATCTNIVYSEKVVNDGADTAFTVHSLVEDSGLILVGRRHKEDLPQLSGIVAWNQFPELGHIGDIMVTSQLEKPISILVLQQQGS